MKFFLQIILVLILSSQALAGEPLTPAQIDRVRAIKKLLGEADTKTFEKTVSELQKTGDCELTLQLQEAVAKVYAEIVAEQNITDLSKEQWLYGVVALNMANIQFGGRPAGPLNRMITQRLRKSLSPAVYSNPGFHVSVE